MIKQIAERFPETDGKQIATLSSATVTLQDMAERTISSTVKFDGQTTPDFSQDWEVEYKGERYIMPLRKPQGAKDNTSLSATTELTFYHWAEYQLKRYYFFTAQSTNTDTYIPDQYIAGVSLPLTGFIDLFNIVLNYYFNGKIIMVLAEEWEGKTSPDPVNISISYSYLWDVLIQFYDLFAMRWKIIRDGDVYKIVIGHAEAEPSHIFEYGFDGGLLSVERQVQDDNIRNKLLGRGGSKNLPLRYFKKYDSDNPTFAEDPDAIPELENVFFSELRSKEFRDYIQGWKTNRHRKSTYSDGTPASPRPLVDSTRVLNDWAYAKGAIDARFDPPEYVKDNASIATYGELVGSLENNEEIYPSIQGRSIDGLGRIDEVVEVEEIFNNTVIVDAALSQSQTTNIGGTKHTAKISASEITDNTVTITIEQNEQFDIGPGRLGIFKISGVNALLNWWNGGVATPLTEDTAWKISDHTLTLVDAFGETYPASGIPEGVYTYRVDIRITLKKALSGGTLEVLAEVNGGTLTTAKINNPGSTNSTFRVWIKNVWQSAKSQTETAAKYVDRIWTPILGDGKENEAKLVFASGQLSISEDYEFKIIKVEYDTGQRIAIGTDNLGFTQYADSEWCLTLEKSDADYESTGLYVPSTFRQGKAGDFFFFTGIDLPHQYVLLAEQALQDYKLEELAKVADISPTWQVSVDRVRVNEIVDGKPLIEWLVPGAPLRLADKRFITNELGSEAAYETLYIQSVTLTYREPSSSDAALNPDIELVLSNNYSTTASPVAMLQGSVNALSRQLGSIGNIEQIIRAVGDKIYLRKDGLADRSVSPTEFANLLTSYKFRQGMIGGQGWGFYRDANGNWVLETDILKARQDFEVNNLVINQIQSRGGMIVESAAALEISSVQRTDEGYVCYFDQKDGAVENLFHVGDVALCHRFNPQATTTPAKPIPDSSGYEKFYKRRVLGIGDSYVILAANMVDVNGSGTPDPGDVIVQYGSYTDATRRFVIIRDVVGGGYERFIEGLASVDHTGTEYFFIGKQNGMYNNRARFFLGNDDNFIEFLNGKLNVKATLSVESTIGNKPIDQYIEDATNNDVENYALQTASPLEIQLEPQPPAIAYYRLYDVTGLVTDDRITCSFDFELDGLSGSSVQFYLHFGTQRRSLGVISGANLNNGGWRQLSSSLTMAIGGVAEDTVGYLEVLVNQVPSGTIRIKNFMVQKGDKAYPWRPNSSERGVLYHSLLGNTTISGGLVLSSVIETGQQSGEEFIVRAGMSGLIDSGHDHRGVVFWGGGSYEQASEGNSTYVIYMDGTGHAAGGTIKFLENKLRVGDIITLNADGMEMTDANGAPRMSLGNFMVAENEKYKWIMTDALTKTFYEQNMRKSNGDLISKYLLFHTAGGGTTIGVYYTLNNNQLSFRVNTSDSTAPQPLVVPYGGLLKGSVLTVADSLEPNGKLEFMLRSEQTPIPYFSSIGSCPAIAIELYSEKKRIPGARQLVYAECDVEAQSIYWRLDKQQWTADKDYPDVEIRISLVNNYSGGSNSTRWGIEYFGATERDIITEVKLPQYNETRLGNDGMMFSWGNSNLFQVNNFWGVRVGSYGFQISSEGGIRVLKDGVWKQVNLDKIIS